MAVSTLRDYVEVLKRRKSVVLLALVLGPVAAVLRSLRQRALYESSAHVLIGRANLATQLEGLTDSTTLDPGRTAQIQAQLARVPEVAARALEAAKLDRSPSDLLGLLGDLESELVRWDTECRDGKPKPSLRHPISFGKFVSSLWRPLDMADRCEDG